MGTGGEAVAEEAGGQDAGVVEDEEVAGLEDLGEVGEDVVVEGGFGVGVSTTVHHEHAAGAALGGGMLGDEVFREVEVEVGDAHWFESSCAMGCRRRAGPSGRRGRGWPGRWRG